MNIIWHDQSVFKKKCLFLLSVRIGMCAKLCFCVAVRMCTFVCIFSIPCFNVVQERVFGLHSERKQCHLGN